MEFVSCYRCGYTWEAEGRRQRVVCSSCRARKANIIKGCIPWHGDYASDLITPIDEFGQPFDWITNCGNRDCQNPEHRITLE